MPSLELLDRTETISGRTVGQYCLDNDNHKIVFLKWATLYRKHSTYSFTAEFLDGIETETIYITDKDSGEVFKFTKSQYQDGPLVKEHGDYQYVLDRNEALDKWDSLDEVLE